MSNIPNTIAGQLHHMKPDDLTPGADVGMMPLPDGISLGIYIRPYNRVAVIVYDEGADLYNVAVGNAPDHVSERTIDREFIRLHRAATSGDEGGGYKVTQRAFCDDLGRLVWGDENAKPWTMPYGKIQSFDRDGNLTGESEF